MQGRQNHRGDMTLGSNKMTLLDAGDLECTLLLDLVQHAEIKEEKQSLQ